jgi:hypothetical protein
VDCLTALRELKEAGGAVLWVAGVAAVMLAAQRHAGERGLAWAAGLFVGGMAVLALLLGGLGAWGWLRRRRAARAGSTGAGPSSLPRDDARPWRTLHAIGYWVDTRSAGASDGLPHPREFVDASWDAGTRADVVRYLEAGRQHAAYLGFSHCRICGREPLGTTDLTDGVFVWPEGLAHYVREHEVGLPPAFLDHARSQGLVVGDADGVDGEDARVSHDLTLWLEYARWRGAFTRKGASS